MIVYRLEDQNGNGPRSNETIKNKLESIWDGSFELICHDVKPGTMTVSHVCGVDELGKLQYWFKPVIVDVRDQGFSVAVYEISSKHVLRTKSDRQVAFVQHKATKLRTLDWEEVLGCWYIENTIGGGATYGYKQ